MRTEIKLRYQTDFLVLLDEEYGYRKWFWFPNMSAENLERWWSELESVEPYFMTPEPLPGELYQVKGEEEFDLFYELRNSSEFYTAHTHCDDDSVLIRPDSSKIFHEGYENK